MPSTSPEGNNNNNSPQQGTIYYYVDTSPHDHDHVGDSFESQSNPFGFEALFPTTASQGGTQNQLLSAEIDNFYLKLSDLADFGEIDETDPVALARFHQEAAQVFAEGVLINIKLAKFFEDKDEHEDSKRLRLGSLQVPSLPGHEAMPVCRRGLASRWGPDSDPELWD
ncbi:unnamed protein product [Penicillium pancosmium]